MKNITSRFFVGAGLATVMMVMQLMASAATLYRQLELGMSGSDVRDLKTFLAQKVTIYPKGIVKCYFVFQMFSGLCPLQGKCEGKKLNLFSFPAWLARAETEINFNF